MRLTEADGRKALRDHATEKAEFARRKYGGNVDYAAVLSMLDDREIVRYPTRLCFDAGPLEPGEFAYAQPVGSHPRDGFRLCMHPAFEGREELLPLLVAYHVVRINYGEIATHEEAECFGATLMGMAVDDYYAALCAAGDEVTSAGG